MDKYDTQIATLNAITDEYQFQKMINWNWTNGIGLFAYVGDGCLTMIRAHDERVYNYYYGARDANGNEMPELTERIKKDKRLPKDLSEIRREHLPVFAELQRVCDEAGVIRDGR